MFRVRPRRPPPCSGARTLVRHTLADDDSGHDKNDDDRSPDVCGVTLLLISELVSCAGVFGLQVTCMK